MIFNRPEKVQTVLNEIAKYKPTKLYVIGDGPRFAEEEQLCQQCRDLINKVDWECSIEVNYSQTNLGCKKRISSGLEWMFSKCEESIILEDDCFPDITFFEFCHEMLNYFRSDERIMTISGNNFQVDKREILYSYYFSVFPHIWGWASWSRAWKFYDVDMKLWPSLRNTKWLLDIHHDEKAVDFWRDIFDQVYYKKIDTWDYQWTFANWSQHGLTIIPRANLVKNIGFDQSATHTKTEGEAWLDLKNNSIDFPLSHPPHVVRDLPADIKINQRNFLEDNGHILKRIIPGQIRRVINKLIKMVEI